MGMPYELYWDGDADAVKWFQKAHELRQEQDNTKLWIQGLYILEAVAAVLSTKENRHQYPKKPYNLTQSRRDADEAEREDSEKQLAIAKLTEWATRNNRILQKKKEEEAKKNSENADVDSAKTIETEGGEVNG